jgi:hypothetical protein
MKAPRLLGEQSQGSRAEELKRRHVEARRRRTRRRRAWIGVAAVVAAAFGVGLGVVAVKALEPKAPAGGSAAGAASASPKPVSGAVAENPESAPPSPAASASPTAGSGATATPTPSPTPKPAPSATPKPRFVAARALRDIRALEAFGVRSGGSSAEQRGADDIAARLREAGVSDVKIRTFPLAPIGKTSRNVIAVIPGESEQTLVLGAHMDSKAPSPGANDNGSGCGALLEIARCLAQQPAYPTVKLVFFGCEEMVDANPDHHHYGSRAFVAGMSRASRKNVAGMISVDMIGYGPDFVVRSMGRGPQSMVRLLQQQAGKRSIHLAYLIDTGPSGYSDHEAFELAGIPAAWIEWRDDPVYHTSADASGHIVPAKVRLAGQLVLDVLYDMDDATLEQLTR